MKTPIDQSVDRFLCWKLPEGFCPDNGITFKRESDYEHPEFGRTKYEPTGTNLFDAQQAKAMLEHVCEPLTATLAERDAEVANAREKLRLLSGVDALEILYAAGLEQEHTIAAQRRVLEQALEALNSLFAIPEIYTGKGGGGVAVWRLGGSDLPRQAITAIQEQLK